MTKIFISRSNAFQKSVARQSQCTASVADQAMEDDSKIIIRSHQDAAVSPRLGAQQQENEIQQDSSGAYLLTVLRRAPDQTENCAGQQFAPSVIAVEDDEGSEESVFGRRGKNEKQIIQEGSRFNSFLIKPAVFSSSCSTSSKNRKFCLTQASSTRVSRSSDICQPLPVPPRLPKVRAGLVVGIQRRTEPKRILIPSP